MHITIRHSAIRIKTGAIGGASAQNSLLRPNNLAIGYFRTCFAYNFEIDSLQHFFFDWTHSAVTLHVCGLHRAPYRPIHVTCQRLLRRCHSPTESRERTQRPMAQNLLPLRTGVLESGSNLVPTKHFPYGHMCIWTVVSWDWTRWIGHVKLR